MTRRQPQPPPRQPSGSEIIIRGGITGTPKATVSKPDPPPPPPKKKP